MNKLEFYEEKNGFAEYQQVYDASKRVYRFADLHDPKTEAVILEAQRRWRETSRAYMEANGDRGTCVLGNGLAVAVKPPRARRAFRLLIATPVGQSEFPGLGTIAPIVAYLKENGIECWYECGRMD